MDLQKICIRYSFRAGSGGADLPDQDDSGGTEDDSDGTYLVPYVV